MNGAFGVVRNDEAETQGFYRYCDACSMSVVGGHFLEIKERVICDECVKPRFAPDNYANGRVSREPTPEQILYLHGLGWRDFAPITKDQASRLICIFRVVRQYVRSVVRTQAASFFEELTAEELARIAGTLVEDWGHIYGILALQAERWRTASEQARLKGSPEAASAYLPPIVRSRTTDFVWRHITQLRSGIPKGGRTP